MPKKASGEFNQTKYVNEWAKQNMLSISVSYKKDFVQEFREACAKLGIKQSDVFRQAMQSVIDKANTTN